jgi:uncharacterized protein YbjT (DUF2867 family)
MEVQLVKDDKTALLFGATGLIGGYCLNFLLASPAYNKVKVFTRKELDFDNEKLEQHKIDFDKLENYKDLIKGDDVFCCLGTTMRKAGNKEAFRKVDYDYGFQIAKIAEKQGVNQFLLVSSVGADADSVFFYNQVKGELEDAVKKMDFWSTHIFQPSVLLGKRNENRWGEQLAGRLAKGFDFLTGGLLTKYSPVEAEVVAKAMVVAAQGLDSGLQIYPSHILQKIAKNEERLRLK